MLLGVIKLAIRKVYHEERAEITVEGGSHEAIAQNLISIANDPTKKLPLSLRCLYEFIVVGMSKIESNDIILVANFFYLGVLMEYACLAKEFRLILIAFKMHILCVNLAFSNPPALEQLLPGIAFAEGELETDMCTSEEAFLKEPISPIEFAEDDLGRFREYRLNKFERVVISNLSKDYEPFLFEFKLMSKLMRSCEVLSEGKPEYKDSEFRMENSSPLGQVFLNDILGLIEPADTTCSVLFGTKCKCKPLRNELAKMYSHLLFNDERSIDFCKTLVSCINHDEYMDIAHYERILFSVLTMNDTFIKERIAAFLNLSIKLMDNNIAEYAFVDVFTAMIIKFGKKNRIFRKELYGHNLVDKINKWLGSNSNPPLGSLRSSYEIFKNRKHNHKISYDLIGKEVQLIKEYNADRKVELKNMHKKLNDYEDVQPESEDDLYDDELEAGSKIDYMVDGTYEWNTGTVIVSMGEIVKVQGEIVDMDIDGGRRIPDEQWIYKDENDLARANTKSISKKAAVVNLYNKAYIS